MAFVRFGCIAGWHRRRRAATRNIWIYGQICAALVPAALLAFAMYLLLGLEQFRDYLRAPR